MHWNKVSTSLPSFESFLTGDFFSLAYAELYLCLGMLLKEFDFRVLTGDDEMALIDVFATFFNTRKVELELRRRVGKSA